MVSNILENRTLFSSVLIGDVLIANALYWCIGRMFGEDMYSHAVYQTMIVNTVLYLACTIRGGVVLYRRNVHIHHIVMRVMENVFVFSVLDIAVLLLGRFNTIPYPQMIIFWIAMLLTISLYRVCFRMLLVRWRKAKKRVRNVVIVGNGYNALELYREMTCNDMAGYCVHGYFDYERGGLLGDKCTYLGLPENVTDYLKSHTEVHDLYCCLPSRHSEDIMCIIKYCVNHLVHFYSMPNVSNYLHHRMYFNMFGEVPYLSLYREPLTKFENRFVKRLFDICVSATFLVTLFPIIFIVVAVVTKITMPGPVFFRQKRTGLNGRDFYCLKFRSMRVNKDADTVQATKNDPRKTRWGDIMRRTNIDELPQFINVLLGDMSIVGPRPHMVKHTNDYSKIIDQYMVRHYIKPGITGWSQVTGFRGETKHLSEMEGRIRGDIWYMEHWSVWLDIYIMYKTVANAVKGDKQAF